MSFLTAEWRKLILANYEVDPAILRPYLPFGTNLDDWQGKHYVSLVGFMFKNTRVLGIKIPFHVNFEEVNLRFYVKYQEDGNWKRGVVFIKEIVPRAAITLLANTLYREHYATRRMRHHWVQATNHWQVGYDWKSGSSWQHLGVTASPEAVLIPEGSEAEFITQHFWGYTKVNDRRTYEYEVTHPRWESYAILDYSIQVDFAKVYGPAFAGLNLQEPASVMLAEGSPITVEPKRTI